MKKLFALGAAVLVAGIVTTARAETIVAVNTADVSATVTGLSALFTDVLKMSDNSAVVDRTLKFGTIAGNPAAWSNKPGEAIKIKVDDNALSWRLRTYTDNFATAPSTTTWGFNFGGLKGNVDGAKASMGWMILPDTGTHAAGGPGTGDPSQVPPNGWTFVKDAKDYDDPNTAASDESFASSDGAGYTNVAFGTASFTRIVRPNIGGGNEALASRDADFYYYAEANFNGATAATYGTTIKFDLINQ